MSPAAEGFAREQVRPAVAPAGSATRLVARRCAAAASVAPSCAFAELPAERCHVAELTLGVRRAYARVRPVPSASLECGGQPSRMVLAIPASSAPVVLSKYAAAAAHRTGIPQRANTTARLSEAPAPSPKRAWAAPRSWAQLAATSTPTKGRSAVLAHSPAISVNVGATPEPSPGLPDRRTKSERPQRSRRWVTRQPASVEQLYESAHEQSDAPLTVPRGLINPGNGCFANVVLQMLVHTAPFYLFFTQLSTLIPQDLSNSTPLLEAMIRFLAEFRETTDGAASVSDTEAFVPDYVYDAMRLNRRFDFMQLGHQEDAEEFLGHLLNTLHEEVLLVERRAAARRSQGARRGRSVTSDATPVAKSADTSPTRGAHVHDTPNLTGVDDGEEVAELIELTRPPSPNESDQWLEVGQKGKTSTTRATTTSESPVTRMFDGKLRSVLHCPGSKSSITLEPFRSLPLDIQPPHVHSVQDALHQLTEPEVISGVWSPARSAFVDARKQVCIEALPPILVLHLKRFMFDEVGGVQKNCKQISYPLRFHIDAEVQSAPLRRVDLSPEYRLYGVVYHHGKFASGGHYTVDVVRQDGSGWINIDDTQVTPIPAEEVVRKGSAPNEPGEAFLLFYQRVRAPAGAGAAVPA